jgi:K+-sensing histidine kinase KdpD
MTCWSPAPVWAARPGAARPPAEGTTSIPPDAADAAPPSHLAAPSTDHGPEDRDLADLMALRSTFISIISHELRTPLTSIAAFTEMLGTPDMLAPEERTGAVAAIARNAERMQVLLEDLTMLAGLASGEVSPPVVPVALAPLVRSAVRLLRALAPRLSVRVEIAEGPPVPGDRALLRQLIQIMVSALACTKAGTATVRTEADETGWTVTMTATAAGEMTEELMLATVLPAGPETGPPRSVALSMLLARAIASNQGGVLRTTTEPERVALTLRLPAAPVDAGTTRARPVDAATTRARPVDGGTTNAGPAETGPAG